MFFRLSVTPAQWWVFTLGIETTKPASRTERGSHSSSHAAVIGFQLHSPELVAVEIHELDLQFVEMPLQTCRLHHKFSIALMTRAFADHNASSAETKERSCRRSDKSCVCVYGSRQTLDQIWFEKNRPAQHLWPEQLLPQGDAKVFKKYSQMKLQMKREALKKLNRKANEGDPGFNTERPN
jgi:hypothetical protein